MRNYRDLTLSGLVLAALGLSACLPIDDRDVQLKDPVGETETQVSPLPLFDGGNPVNGAPNADCQEGECSAAVGRLSSEPSSAAAGEEPKVDAGPLAAAACPGCLIDGSCVSADALEAQNVCRICDPARDANGWSPNDQVVCDDGLFCTADDVCQAGACNGTPRVCDDEVACNGVSTCQETSDSCSPSTNECGANRFCDVTSASCVSTCMGCLVDDVCIPPAAEKPGEPCLTCQPAISTVTYTPAVGKSCGLGPAECSRQDSCDTQGRCQPNHLPANMACGSSISNACNRSDACDGNGSCEQRVVANGTACDDGSFCSVGDRCQGGQCASAQNRDCGVNRACDEGIDQCQCQGCQVGETCFLNGDTNPGNPCQICDVNRSQTAFSANVGSTCGLGTTDCSAQDTCDSRGQCAANDRADGTNCSGQAGFCRSGQCASRQQFGTECTLAMQCLSGFCRTWFVDIDGDRHGNPAQPRMLCSLSPMQDTIRPDGAGLLIPTLTVGSQEFVALGDDCCDSTGFGGNIVFPGKVSPVSGTQTACPSRPPRDFDCDGVETCFEGTPTVCL
jgi:hypothetical protein